MKLPEVVGFPSVFDPLKDIEVNVVRTVREIIDRILLSPAKRRGQGEWYKRDRYFSSGPKARAQIRIGA